MFGRRLGRLDRRRRAIGAAAWSLALGCASFVAHAAGPSAAEILRQAVRARGEVDYSATATVTNSPAAGPARTLTQSLLCRRGGKERVQFRDSSGALVGLRVCDGQTVWEHWARRRRVIRREAAPAAARRKRDLDNLAALGSNFGISLAGTETVAGRPAYRVQITRPGGSVLARQYWIDQETHLELKSERYDGGGRLVNSVELTRVNYSPQFPADAFVFRPPPDLKPEVVGAPKFRGSLAQAEQVAGFKALPPPRPPAGFRLLPNSVAVRQYQGAPVLWLRYTNGLDTFSIFQRRFANCPVFGEEGGPVRQWVHGGFHFTLVGRLSPEQANLIANGYRQ